MNNINQQAPANMAPAVLALRWAPAALLTCPEPCCGVTAATHRAVIAHRMTAHNYVKLYQCTEAGCSKSYVHKGDRDDPVLTKHRGGKNWRCPVLGCTKTYVEAKKVLIRKHFNENHRSD